MRIVILAIHRESVEKKLSLGFHYNNNEKKIKGHITLFKTKCLEVSEDCQVKNQHRAQDLLSGLRVFS